MPLSFAPAEAYQFDWSHECVVIDGVTTMVKVAQVRLCHSRMLFVRAYPREAQEMVFDAHEKAFQFFKGVPRRGIYDNMKTAVDAVFIGKDRAFNRRFAQLLSHHLIEPTACTPAAGWEKGQVENQVGFVRRLSMGPELSANVGFQFSLGGGGFVRPGISRPRDRRSSFQAAVRGVWAGPAR